MMRVEIEGKLENLYFKIFAEDEDAKVLVETLLRVVLYGAKKHFQEEGVTIEG